MLVTVFINEKDKSIDQLGKALVSILNKKYYVFTRMKSEYPLCTVENTMSKLQEILIHRPEESRILISFGCRVLPQNLQEIETLAEKNTGNIVFLKRLKGSKTWRVEEKGLTFDNERIADCGIFVLESKELLDTSITNFNTYIRNLLLKKKLNPVFVDFWLFANTEHRRD